MALKLQQLRISVGITTKGEPKLLYLGPDSAKADEAIAKAGPEFDAVGAYPKGVFPIVPRYPAKEAARAKEVSEAAARREEAVKNAKRLEAEAKAAHAEKLAAEAAATLKDLAPKAKKVTP